MRRDEEYVDGRIGEESRVTAFAMRAGEMDPFAPFGAQFTSPVPAPSTVIVIDLCDDEVNPQAEMSQM
jgi:hypothetical protein